MAELKAGSWPITDTDIDAIDPHAEFIPRGPEADKEAAEKWRPWGLEDRSDNTNVRKDYDASDKFKTKDDEYMNKAPNEKLKESLDSFALGSQSWDRKEAGLDGEGPYQEYYFDAEGLQKLADLTGRSVEELKALSLPMDGFDDETKAAAGVPDDYEEYAFDVDDIYAQTGTDWDDTDDPSFNPDFMDESRKRRKVRKVREAQYGMPDEDYQGDANPDVVDARDVADDPNRLHADPEEESSREAVDTEGEPSLPVYLQYDSAEDTEFSSGLDSFQHTKSAPAPEMDTEAIEERGVTKQDRLLRERFAVEQMRLTEARGAKAELINQYLSQATNPDYDDFISWAQQQGEEDIPNKYYFNNLLKKRGGTGSGGYEVAPVEEREPFNPEDAPEELQQLMNLYAQASDEDAQVEPSVDQKFKGIYAVGYRTAKGRALKRHAFICGSPGIGKTFTVAKAVEKGAEEGKQLFAKFRGSIGKSLSAILAFLWMHRENYVVLLDDADGFLTGSTDEVMNTLKAAMDTDEPMVSTGSPHIRKNVAKMVGMSESERWPGALNFDTSRLHEGVITAVDRNGDILAEELLTDSEQRFWEEFTNANQPKSETKSFLESSLLGRVQEGFFDDDDDEEGNDLGLEDEIEDEGEGKMLPAQFFFGSRIIFISNMMQSDIPDAIAGRCNVKELYLTRPEIMVRLEQILPELLKNETAYAPEELAWAKANVFRWMKAVVMAEDMGAPITLASGKRVPVSINVPITFRMFNDFVDGWMSLADEAALDASEANFDQLEEQIALQFISQVIIPALAGDRRSAKKRRR